MQYPAIGCLGRARHGKGELSRILADYYESKGIPVQVISFADPIKEFLADLIGRREPFRGNDAERNAQLPELTWKQVAPRLLTAAIEVYRLTNDQINQESPSGRQLMQLFGSDVVRDGFVSDTWARIAANRTRKFDGVTCVDDVRFCNEAKPRREGGLFDMVFKVIRPDLPLLSHKSETSVDLVPGEHITAVFRNDTTVPELRQKVFSYLADLKQ